MENTVNEGQTQVYTDGHIDAQPGVNLDAPYLNQPRQQLMDIIHVLFSQSGRMSDIDNDGKIDHSGSMTDQQVMTILVGMGIPQQMAMSGIAQYRQMYKDKSNIYTENNNQKKKFTISYTEIS